MSPLPRRRQALLLRSQPDADAFGAFYDAYSERVLRFFARRLMDAEVAFDLMSETFAKALESAHQFRGNTPEEEQAWLFAIARSELSRYWRRGAVERQALTRLGIPVPELSDGEIERIEELAQISDVRPLLTEALGDLPEEQRRAIRLRIVDELSYSEIAEQLGVPEQVARARVSRGLRALARVIVGGNA